MMRCLALLIAPAVLVGLMDDGARPKLPPGVPEFVADPSWVARAGASGSVRRSSAGGTTEGNYRRYRIAADAADLAGVEALARSGAVVSLESGDAIQVVRDLNPAEPPRVQSTRSFLDGIATAGMREAPPDLGIECRILTGKHAGKTLVIPKDNACGLMPNPRPWLNIRPGKAVVLVDPEIPIAVDIESYRRLRGNPDEASDLIAKGKAFRAGDDAITVNEVVVDRKKKVETDAAKVRAKGKATRYGVVYRGNLMPAAK